MRFFLTISLLISCISYSIAQIDMPVYDYNDKTTFNIGGIKITGAENRDRNAIKSIAGLRVGKEIDIPGEVIPKAIKSLYKLRLFEDVQIIQEKIEDNLIYLEIILKERPTLSRYSITGEKKKPKT